MARRAYSDEFKARALAVVEMNGGNVAAAWRDITELYGDVMPKRTLYEWANGTGVQSLNADIRILKKDELVAALDKLLLDAIEDAPKKQKGATYQDVIRAIGVLTDKRLLLRGEATDITETRKGRTVRIDWGDGSEV